MLTQESRGGCIDGQTGSGKTHSMMGQLETEERGVIPRLIEGIFRNIELADESIEFTVGKESRDGTG